MPIIILYLQRKFPVILCSRHEIATDIKQASACAENELNIQAGIIVMNAVAPTFMSKYNVLRSSPVQWTLSWIYLALVSTQQTTSTTCCQATRSGIKEEEMWGGLGRSGGGWGAGGWGGQLLCITETLRQFWSYQEFQGDYFWNSRAYLADRVDILAFTYTFIHIETHFCSL